MNLNGIIESINIQQLILSALAVSLAGVVGFWFKDFPKQLWNFVVRECTCTLTITSQHFSYFGCMAFLAEKLKNKKLKSYKAMNTNYNENNNLTQLSMGYGSHLIWLDKTPVIITLKKDENNQQIADKDIITIKKLGRNKQIFDNLLKEVNNIALVDKNGIESYQYSNYWSQRFGVRKRDFNTIFIEQDKKDKIINTIDNFKNNEQWYVDNGIPYHLGILLYGPPGTGKTSLIKAIATHYNKKISYLPASKLHSIDEAVTEMRKDSLLVIEDIDCQSAVQTRSNKDMGPDITVIGTPDNFMDKITKISFSDILNSLDGLLSTHGYMFIATTNHIEQLDEALLRPGRIDLSIEVGYVTLEVLNQFLQHYYNVTTDIEIREDITVAQLQQLLLEQKTGEDIIQWARKELEDITNG